jgi:hypothetical protein
MNFHKIFLLYIPCGLMGWWIGGWNIPIWESMPLAILAGAGWAFFYRWACRPKIDEVIIIKKEHEEEDDKEQK